MVTDKASQTEPHILNNIIEGRLDKFSTLAPTDFQGFETKVGLFRHFEKTGLQQSKFKVPNPNPEPDPEPNPHSRCLGIALRLAFYRVSH